MKHTFTALLTALALAASTLAPSTAAARDYRHSGRGYHGYHHRDHGDAVAAGVVGLALGVALGAALSDNNDRRDRCYDGCGAPPPQQGYYDRSGDGYADYGPPPPGYADRGDVCVRQVRQWDPYAGRYVWVNLRTYC